MISLVYFSFEDVVGCVRDWVNGIELSIDQFARDKVRMVTELELFLLASSSVPFSSIFMEMELVPFKIHKHWNRFWNLELIVPLHNTAGVIA